MPLSGFGINAKLTSQNKMESIVSYSLEKLHKMVYNILQMYTVIHQ